MRSTTLWPKARTGVAAVVLVALAGLTGCSGAASDNATTSADEAGSGGGQGAPRSLARTADGVADDGQALTARPAGVGRSVVRPRSVIRTGRVSLTAEDLGSVRREIGDLLAAVGGSVDRETSTDDAKGRLEASMLVLRMSVRRFDSTRDAIERLGRRVSSRSSGKDVTTQVIDVAERVQTLQNSLDRLQRFQRSAADVRDLIRFEDQITRRQSELQSLEAQQSYLADQTSMSTLTVELATPEAYVAPPGALDDAGFLTGLRGGWQALVGFGVVVLTVLGAALPFLVTVTLLGIPAWLLLRGLRRRRREADVPVPDSP